MTPEEHYQGLTVMPEIEASAQYDVPDNQMLLSFGNDEACAMFADWWDNKGYHIYREWVQAGIASGKPRREWIE